jgi:hypothetical protein
MTLTLIQIQLKSSNKFVSIKFKCATVKYMPQLFSLTGFKTFKNNPILRYHLILFFVDDHQYYTTHEVSVLRLDINANRTERSSYQNPHLTDSLKACVRLHKSQLILH